MIFLPIALPVLIGAGIVRLLWPAPLSLSWRSLLTASVGAGVGFGICSCLYFLWLVLFGPRIAGLAIVEGSLCAAIVAAAILAARRNPGAASGAAAGQGPVWLTLAFTAAAAIAVLIFVLSSLTNPDGGWDAIAIWNLRARFLFRGGEWWRDAFSARIPWAHADYPLLVPGIVAMSWAFAGKDSTLLPVSIGFLFLAATAGVLIATLGILRGRIQALIAGTLLLAAGAFVQVSGYQYADAPRGFYILATLALLCLEDQYRGAPGLAGLAGASAGFAAWTKNEGLLFLAAIVLARAFALIRFQGARPAARQMSLFAAGLIPVLAVVGIFKVKFAPPNDLIAPHAGNSVAANLLDGWRYVTVVTAFVKQALTTGGFIVPVILVLAVYLYLVKARIHPTARMTVHTLGLTIALMLAGDFGVYQLLSYALDFQLRTSLDRIFLQLWPAALLAFFFVANTPQLEARFEEKPKTAKRPAKPPQRAAARKVTGA